jgi:hypothetical protein
MKFVMAAVGVSQMHVSFAYVIPTASTSRTSSTPSPRPAPTSGSPYMTRSLSPTPLDNGVPTVVLLPRTSVPMPMATWNDHYAPKLPYQKVIPDHPFPTMPLPARLGPLHSFRTRSRGIPTPYLGYFDEFATRTLIMLLGRRVPRDGHTQTNPTAAGTVGVEVGSPTRGG